MKIKFQFHTLTQKHSVSLTYMQILRNSQQQNNATIFEEKEMGAEGENKQDWELFSHISFRMLGRFWYWIKKDESYIDPTFAAAREVVHGIAHKIENNLLRFKSVLFSHHEIYLRYQCLE